MLFCRAVVVFALGFHVILADEPKCLSRFDYDEKMLLKLLRIEDKLEHIETFIQDIKSTELENLKQTDQQLQMEIDEHRKRTATLFNDNISITNASMSLLKTQLKAVTDMKSVELENMKQTGQQLRMEMNVLQENIATTADHSNKTATLINDNISITNASIGLLQTQIKAVTGPTIAFLVRDARFESGKVVFKSEELNEGNAFTPKTGEFLAPLPGLYYFSFNLLTSYSTKYTYCRFYKNRNISNVYAYADGTTSSCDNGNMSVFIILKKGDVFHVGSCSGNPSVSFHHLTTLTGALIKVDTV